MTSHDKVIESIDPTFQPRMDCLERRRTNRLWACNIVGWNVALDRNPTQCSETNAYARGAFKVLTNLAPNCAACRYDY